jgi:hypothetical protein
MSNNLSLTRRTVLAVSAATGAASLLPLHRAAMGGASSSEPTKQGDTKMAAKDEIRPFSFHAPEAELPRFSREMIYLEGEALKVVELGHTDTSHTTALYVPSIGLVVSGDGVYNNTHLYLAERDEEAIDGWLRALDKIEALHPTAVIAGHGLTGLSIVPRRLPWQPMDLTTT